MCALKVSSWLSIAAGIGLILPASAGAAVWERGTPQVEPPLAGFVQVVALDEVEDASARRRISFYVDKVLVAMQKLAEDDARIANGEGEPDADVLDGFRSAMLRFVDASTKAGLEADSMSEILAEAYADRYDGPEPLQLLDSEGQLEATSLVSTSIGFKRFGEQTSQKQVDYLSAIAIEGSKTREERLSRLAESGEVPPEQELAELAPQTIEDEPVEEVADVVEEIDPVVASIRERITFDGPDRLLVVERGDTLGLIARAIYGDSLLYRSIYSYNRNVMSNPDQLRVGVELRLPEL